MYECDEHHYFCRNAGERGKASADAAVGYLPVRFFVQAITRRIGKAPVRFLILTIQFWSVIRLPIYRGY